MASSIGDARTRRVGARAAGVAATVALAWVAAAAQTPPTDEILRQRRTTALNVLILPSGEMVAKTRAACASGTLTNTVSFQRAHGFQQTPDASDMCPNALARVARDGGLQSIYTQLSSELGGDVAFVPGLPAAVGAAVTRGKTDIVAIGNQRAASINSALALDAGFTVAYQKGAKHAVGMPDLAALKPIAERCYGQAESNLALCYSTGYVYGARVVSGLPLVQ